jgi:hypothetical protein
MKKKDTGEKPHLKKKNTGSRPGHGSTGFCRVVAPDGLLTNPDRSNHQVNRIPG